MQTQLVVIHQIDPMHKAIIGDKFLLPDDDRFWEVVQVRPTRAHKTAYMVDGGQLTPTRVVATLRLVEG